MNGKISEQIKNAHDRVADTYGLSPIGQTPNPTTYSAWNFEHNAVRPLTKIIDAYWHDAQILEAGCGNGQIAEVLLKNGVKSVTGVDFSRNMLANSLRRFKGTGYQNRFHPLMANIESLQMLKTNTFEGAVLFGVMEHLDNPGLVLNSIFSTLKNGSVLAVAIPRKGSLTNLSYVLFGDSPKRWGRKQRFADRFRFAEKTNYYRFFSLSQIYKMLSELSSGQVIERIPFAYSHIDGLPGYPLHLLGKNIQWGHNILDCLDRLCRVVGFIPAGEFWLVKKMN
jgi:SAM-dependent methyltransferase